MKYINELGFIGNIKRLFKGVSDSNTIICNNHAELKELNSTSEQEITDLDIKSLSDEQNTTDLELLSLELEQVTTDLDLRVLELELKEEE